MKHNLKILIILILLFLAAQYVGIYINHVYLTKTLPLNIQRPEINTQTSFIPTIITIIFLTILIILLAKFKLSKLWKAWFFLAVWFSLTISMAVFFSEKVAIIIALLGAVFKVLEVDVYIHNLTEVFIYGGLVAIFAPIFNTFSVMVLLFLNPIQQQILTVALQHLNILFGRTTL